MTETIRELRKLTEKLFLNDKITEEEMKLLVEVEHLLSMNNKD